MALENRGLDCWISSRNVKPGQNYQEQIVKAIRASKIMVLVFSANANNSDEIKKELALASQNKLVVIPVRIEDVVPSEAFAFEFAIRQWIDLFDDWENSIAYLVELVASNVGALSPPPPPEVGWQSWRALWVGGTLGVVLVGSVACGLILFRAQMSSPIVVTALSAEQERALKPNDSFKECTNCPEMAVVPAGHFMMGSLENEPGSSGHERPQHLVMFARQFAVGRFPVTRDEFEEFVRRTTNIVETGCTYWDGREILVDPNRSFKDPKLPGEPQDGIHPVVCVSWNDAEKFVAWISKTTVKDYHLLTEAEWEYAARADTTTAYYWGDEIGKENANCDGCGSHWDDRQTSPVGSFPANQFGLYDMAGNVFEWVEDCWHDSYEGASAEGSMRTRGNCASRVFRGGSWASYPQWVRSAYRGGGSADARDFGLGFRVARTLLPPIP